MEETISLEAKKIELIAKITRLVDFNVLLKIEKILHVSEEESEEWNLLSPDTKMKIEQGLNSIKNGKVLSNEEAKQRIDKYIKEL